MGTNEASPQTGGVCHAVYRVRQIPKRHIHSLMQLAQIQPNILNQIRRIITKWLPKEPNHYSGQA
jgi:hypothetical protein